MCEIETIERCRLFSFKEKRKKRMSVSSFRYKQWAGVQKRYVIENLDFLCNLIL